MTTTTKQHTYFIVPCGGGKLDAPAPARQLYTGSAFRQVLRDVELEAEATRRDLGTEVTVLILSALHGLVELDEVIAPYDTKMDAADSIATVALAAQIVARGWDWEQGDEVYAFLPAAYLERLAAAAFLAADIAVQDVYETAPGIGYQKGLCKSLARRAEVAA